MVGLRRYAILDCLSLVQVFTVDQSVTKRLGEILIERGKLDAAGLERALRLQQDGGEKLGALLVTLGICAQRDVAEALAVQLGFPLLDATGYPEFPILEERVSARSATATFYFVGIAGSEVSSRPIARKALISRDCRSGRTAPLCYP